MKSELKLQEEDAKPLLPYPKLMIKKDEEEGNFIVLFSKDGTGIVVYSSNIYYREGDYKVNPSMDGFEDLSSNYEVRLSNK